MSGVDAVAFYGEISAPALLWLDPLNLPCEARGGIILISRTDRGSKYDSVLELILDSISATYKNSVRKHYLLTSGKDLGFVTSAKNDFFG